MLQVDEKLPVNPHQNETRGSCRVCTVMWQFQPWKSRTATPVESLLVCSFFFSSLGVFALLGSHRQSIIQK